MKISDEKFTPMKYIESARKVFGGKIDLDPASSEKANERVKAKSYFSSDENGLNRRWYGNVWLNPPYSKGKESSLFLWVHRMDGHYKINNFTQGILLTPNWTERKWFQKLWDHPICFTDHRIEFIDGIAYMNTGKSVLLTNPEGGSCFTYFGTHHREFVIEFSKYGYIVGANTRSKIAEESAPKFSRKD